MPRDTSPNFRIETNRTAGTEGIFEAVELTVPFYAGLPTRIERLVNMDEDQVIGGETFQSANFALQLPNDADGELPSAKLAFSTLQTGLLKLIEATHGVGAKARIIIGRCSNPEPEFEITMQFYNIQVTTQLITGDLGFRDLIARPSLNVRYDRRTAAGQY